MSSDLKFGLNEQHMTSFPDQKLFALGPVNVPDRTKAVAPKNISHRSPSMFNPLFQRAQGRIAAVLGASLDLDIYAPMIINGSGTSGAEATVSSFKGKQARADVL